MSHVILKNYLKMGHRPKWIPKPTIFLEENIGKNICDLIHKKKEKRYIVIKIKNPCSSKDTIKEIKRQITD